MNRYSRGSCRTLTLNYCEKKVKKSRLRPFLTAKPRLLLRGEKKRKKAYARKVFRDEVGEVPRKKNLGRRKRPLFFTGKERVADHHLEGAHRENMICHDDYYYHY